MPSYKEQFNLSIFDYSPVGYCVLELVLDNKGQIINGCMSVMKRHMRTGPVRQTCEKKKNIMWSLHQLEKRVSVQV